MGVAEGVLGQRRVVEFGLGDVGHGVLVELMRPVASLASGCSVLS
jgi:hypothetical protein